MYGLEMEIGIFRCFYECYYAILYVDTGKKRIWLISAINHLHGTLIMLLGHGILNYSGT